MLIGGNDLELITCWNRLKVAVIIAWDAMIFERKGQSLSGRSKVERTVAKMAKINMILYTQLEVESGTIGTPYQYRPPPTGPGID